MQGPGPISAPGTVPQGAPIPVGIQAPGITEIIVTTTAGGGKTQKFPAGPGRQALIPADASWAAGTILYISTGQPPFVTIQVEVVSTGV